MKKLKAQIITQIKKTIYKKPQSHGIFLKIKTKLILTDSYLTLSPISNECHICQHTRTLNHILLPLGYILYIYFISPIIMSFILKSFEISTYCELNND